MNTKENLLELVKSLLRWRKPIILTCLAALLCSTVVSLLLPVYYEATTLFLAASPDQSKPEVLYSTGNIEPDYYGEEEDIDRLITLARSRDLVEFMIARFDLYRHYDIDSTQRRAAYKVREAFLDLYEVIKTERDAIEISVQDRDPVRAAEMANAAREKMDELAQNLIRSRQERILAAYTAGIRDKELKLSQLSDTLTALRSRYGIFNIEAQSESLTEQLTRAESKLARDRAKYASLSQSGGASRDTLVRLQSDIAGEQRLLESLSRKMDLFNQGIATYSALDEQFEESSEALGLEQERLQQLRSIHSSGFPSIILVEGASVPEIKARPKRMLIVGGATLIAFIFSLAAVLIIDGYRDVDWGTLSRDT